MANGTARISTVGLLPQEEEDDDEDAAEPKARPVADELGNSSSDAINRTSEGMSNEGFDQGTSCAEENEFKKESEEEVIVEQGVAIEEEEPPPKFSPVERTRQEVKGRKEVGEAECEAEKRRVVSKEERRKPHCDEKTKDLDSRVQANVECSPRAMALELPDGKKEAKQGESGGEEKKRSLDVGRGISAGVILGVPPMSGAAGMRALESPLRRALESPHRRRTPGSSTTLRRRRVEDSRGAASNAVNAWGAPTEGGQPEATAALALTSTTPVTSGAIASGTRVPLNSAPGPSRPPRRSSGPRCQEALSSILWEPYDCRRRRPSLLAADACRIPGIPSTSTFYYHTAFPHPLEDYALWLPPPPYEASTALPLDGPPPALQDFFPITFSSCSSASSSSASSLSTSPSSSSSFLCCSSANGNNTNRFSIDVATARRAVEKAERAAEEASEAALRRARSFQCLPPEGSCAAAVESHPKELPLAACGETGARRVGTDGGGISGAVGGGEPRAAAEGSRKSALVADLGGGEEGWCPYCLSWPREALGSGSRTQRGRCRCKATGALVECSSSRWVGPVPVRKEAGESAKRKGCHSRCEGRGERCPRRSRAGGRTPAAEMVSVAVEGVRDGAPSNTAAGHPPDEEAPRGSAGVNTSVGYTSANTIAADGGEGSGAVVGGVVKVVSCRAAAPETLRVPVPGATQRCVLVGNSNVSNVRISAEVVTGGTSVEGVSGGEVGRTFTSTEAQTDETGGMGAVDGRPGAEEGQSGGVGHVQPHHRDDNREQRRRERRERRHRRSVAGQPAPPPPPQVPPMMHPGDAHWQTRLDAAAVIPCGVGAMGVGERLLPDLLNSHLPPPYSTLPMPPAPPPRLIPIVGGPPLAPPNVPPMMPPPPPPPPPPGSPPQLGGGMRFPFPTPPGRRCRSGVNRVASVNAGVPPSGGGGNGGSGGGGAHYASDEDGPPKSCCGLSAAGVGGSGQPASVRWFVLAIAFVGVCCALVGTVLGALKATGREHLTVSLLMIGVGIVLITVSGVAWRLTSHDAPSCRMMLGLGGSDEGAVPNRRFVPRLPPSYGRPHHPYAAMMYPEFQYRPPPPSYQASMQEYRLRLLLLDRHPGGGGGPGGAVMGIPTGAGVMAQMAPPPPPPHLAPPPHQAHQQHLHAISPPPTYRSYAGSTIREWRCRAGLGLRRADVHQDLSRPPSYRSRASSSARPTLDPGGGISNGSVGQHSRDASLSLSYLSANSHETEAGEGVRSGVNQCDVSVINVNSSLPSSPLPDNLVLMMVTGGSESEMEEKKRVMGEGEGVEVVVEGDGSALLHRLCGGDGKHPGTATVVLDENHLVTIVQTTDSTEPTSQPATETILQQGHQPNSHRSTGQGEAVIVTVSGSTPGVTQNQNDGGEMEILAHL